MLNKEVQKLINTNKWADVPADILMQILKHLHLKTELTRLRGVCSSWRSSLPLHQHTTYRSHLQVPSLRHGNDRPLFLLETAFYFFSTINPSEGSSNSNGWMARMGQIAPNKWRLLSPLSYHQLHDPEAYRNEYLLTDPPIVGEINLLDCRVFLLTKSLTLVDDLDFNAKPLSAQVVGQWDLTSSTRPLTAILVRFPGDQAAWWSRKLLMLRPNDAQKQEIEWAEISLSGQEDKNKHNFVVHGIAYNNEIFFIFQESGDRWRLGTIDPRNKTLVLKPLAGGSIRMSLWGVALVPSISNGGLYLVVSPNCGDSQCYYFGNEPSKNKIIENLGDEILFWSDYVSFSFQSTLLNGNPLQDENSLAICYMFSNDILFNYFNVDNEYFNPNVMPKEMEITYPRYKESISVWFTRLKYFDDKSILDFDGDNQNDTVMFFAVMPKKEQEVYATLFFPPPAWVKWRCPSLDNVEIKLDELPDYAYHDHYESYNSYVDSDFDFVSSTYE